MISYIITLIIFIICTILTIFNKSIICFEETSFACLIFFIFTLFLSFQDILFSKSNLESLNSGDNILWTYEEKVIVYRIRGLVLLPSSVFQFFLIFTFGFYTKLILTSVIFVFSYAIAILSSYLGTKKLIISRLNKEENERKQQEINEELGKI